MTIECPKTSADYKIILQRIRNAEAQPTLLDQHRDLYDALVAAAREYEMRERIWTPALRIPDETTRQVCMTLIAHTKLMLTTTDAYQYHLACEQLYSDMMAMALVPEDEVLSKFGYKEVAEDDD